MKSFVRNGYLPQRQIQTGLGNVEVKISKVRDRSGQGIKFNSKLMPPYLKRAKRVEEFLPFLYLKGVSTGDFSDALKVLLGDDAEGLSAGTISRLKEKWQHEHKAWSKRDLSSKNYVYLWADGIYFNVRGDNDRSCILVIMGATDKGKKELVAIEDGHREGEQSWTEVLQDLRNRNLNKLPKLVQPKVKESMQNIWMAETRKDAYAAFDNTVKRFGDKYQRAMNCLEKDKETMLAFYDFLAKHWRHIRTSNPIESTFATVRLRTNKTRNCVSRDSIFAMVFNISARCRETLAAAAWVCLNGRCD